MNAPIKRPTKASIRRAAVAAGIQFDALVTYAMDCSKSPAEWLADGYQGAHKYPEIEPLQSTLTVLFANDWGMPERENVTLEKFEEHKIVAVPGTPLGCDFGWLVCYELEVVAK